MKKILVIIISLIVSSNSFSQIQTRLIEEAHDLPKIIMDALQYRMAAPVKRLPPIDVEALRREDNENRGINISFRFGKPVDVSWTLDDGAWIELNEERIWSISVESTNAVSLSFFFNDVTLPDNASLFIVNDKGDMLFGPITSENIPNIGKFSSDLIPGYKATIILTEPKVRKGQSSLKINRVVHGYRDIQEDYPNRESTCYTDVACYPEYELESRAIVKILNINPGYTCTGALIMNTARDLKPYILTGFHCLDADSNQVLSSAEKANCAYGTFFFNNRYTSCGGNAISNENYVFSGSTFRAAWANTDFALLELTDTNTHKKPYLTWLGWDRSNTQPLSGTCLHHPHGYPMKISVDEDPITSSNHNGSLETNYWNTHFEDGPIGKGSSGSPLLDQKRRVIGQLHGHFPENQDTCNWLEGWYGKIYESWTGGGTNSTRLSNWLDPLNTGQTTIDGTEICEIAGPTVPCGSSVYYVDNLRPNAKVMWSWIYSSQILQTPDSNQIIITNSNNGYIKDILQANIIVNGIQSQQIYKDIDTGANFAGTYTQLGSPNSGIPNKYMVPFKSGDTFQLYRGSEIVLISPKFNGANLTYTGITPNYYSHNGDTITFQYLKTNSGYSHYTTLEFTGKIPSTCENYKFTIPIYNPANLPPIILLAHQTDTYIDFSLVRQPETDGDVSSSENTTADAQSTKLTGWKLTIANALTGQLMYEGTISEKNIVVNTSDWNPGIYVAQAKYENETTSSKIVIQSE